VVRTAKENSGGGNDRLVGPLANLGHKLSDQTVGNILGRYDIPPAPKRNRTTSWRDFIRAIWMFWPGLISSTLRLSLSRG
jgi:putative transposase